MIMPPALEAIRQRFNEDRLAGRPEDQALLADREATLCAVEALYHDYRNDWSPDGCRVRKTIHRELDAFDL